MLICFTYAPNDPNRCQAGELRILNILALITDNNSLLRFCAEHFQSLVYDCTIFPETHAYPNKTEQHPDQSNGSWSKITTLAAAVIERVLVQTVWIPGVTLCVDASNEKLSWEPQVVARGMSLPFMKNPLSPHSSQRAPSCRSEPSS